MSGGIDKTHGKNGVPELPAVADADALRARVRELESALRVARTRLRGAVKVINETIDFMGTDR